MHFQRFVAWENLPSLTSKSDGSSSSSKSGSVSEFASEGLAVPKITTTKKETMPVEIPIPVRRVLDKIDVEQLERAKKEISKKLFRILENVNRAYERYKKDDGMDPKLEKEYNTILTWEEKSRRSHFLDDIDDVLNVNMDKLLELRLVLDSLKECRKVFQNIGSYQWECLLANGMLKKVELQEKLIPSEEIVEKMEWDLLKFIEKIEGNVQRLIKLFQPLFAEKMKARRKSGQKYTLLFKAWRDKVADTPQEGEPLTPEQMLDDESLAFTRCHDVNNMIHELGESSFFNKAEIVALKYTATMVGNLIKAFSLLVKQCRNLKLKCDSLTIVEGRKQDPQVLVLQRELRMALERKTALEKQVQSAEERCMALLVTNEMIQKELQDANEKASLADNITLSRVTPGKPQTKTPVVEKDVKSKQAEKPKLPTEPKKKLTRKGEGEILDEKWESQGESSEASLLTIYGREPTPTGSIQDIKIKQKKAVSDKGKTKQPPKTTDEKRPPMDGTVIERSPEVLDEMLTSHKTLDTESDRVVPKSSYEKPMEKSPSTMEPSSLTEPAAEDISGQSLQKDKKGARRKLSMKGTADKVVVTMKTKKMVKFPVTKDTPTQDMPSQDIAPLYTTVQEIPEGELTQRPIMTSETKKEPETLDKTLTQTATAEQTEEAAKQLAEKSKDIREKKETKRWSKLLQLPKQAEKSEGVRPGVAVKLQEIARDIPTSASPTQEIPTLDTSIQVTRTQDIPTLVTPTQDTPIQDTPTQVILTVDTPTQDTPTQDTPTQDTPTQEITRGELTQRPATTSETKEEPASQDKDLTQTAAAKQTEEAPKQLAEKSKDIREKKETKRWSKLLQLPKQAEKSEGVRHSLDAKLQETARDIPTPSIPTQDIPGGELTQKPTTSSETKEVSESQGKNLTQTAIIEQAEEAPKQLAEKSKDIREKKETKRWGKALHVPKQAEKLEGVRHSVDMKLQETARDIPTPSIPTPSIPTPDTPIPDTPTPDTPTPDTPTPDTPTQDIPGGELTQKPTTTSETKEEPESQNKDLIQTAIAEQIEEPPKQLAEKSKDIREKKETKRWGKALQLPKKAEKTEGVRHGVDAKLQETARDIPTPSIPTPSIPTPDTPTQDIPGGELTQKPTTTSETKEEPESQDKDLIQTAIAEQIEEAPKQLAEKSKDIREKKETKRWTKALQLPKQAEKTEGVIHGLNMKLQEIAKEKDGMIDIETIKHIFEELEPSYKDTAAGPVTGGRHADKPAKIKKSTLPPDTAEQAYTTKEKRRASRVEETALREFQEATLACLEDKLEKLKKGPPGSGKASVQFQPTDQQAQQFFKAIQDKVEECFLIKQKSLTHLEEDKQFSQSMEKLEDKSGEEITKIPSSTHVTPTQDISTQDTSPQDIPTQILPPPPQDIPTQVPPPPPQDIPIQGLPPPPQDIPTQVLPPPQQDKPTQILPPPPQDIPTQVLPPPPQDIPTQVLSPPQQEKPPLAPLPQEIPTLATPPKDISTLIPSPSPQDIPPLVIPLQDIPPLVPSPFPQDILPLVPPPQEMPTLFPPPQDIPTLILSSPLQDIPTLVPPPPPQDIPLLIPPPTLFPPPQEIPTLFPPPLEIPPLVLPPLETPSLILPPLEIPPLVLPPLKIPPQILPPLGIPPLVLPPLERPTMVPSPLVIPTMVPPPLEIPSLIPPPLEIPSLIPPPLERSILALPPQDIPPLVPRPLEIPPQIIPTLVPPPPPQDILPLVPPPQEIPTLVSLPQDISPLVLPPPPQEIPSLVPPPQIIPPMVLPPSPQEIPTLVPPPQKIPSLVPPPLERSTLAQPPPPQEIPTLIPSPQVIPTLVPPPQEISSLVPPPLERSTLAQPPPPQEIPTLIPSPQVIPTLVPPPQEIPSLVPPPLERSTLAQPPPPQEIPTLIPSPQVIPTLVPPPQEIPSLVPPPLERSTLAQPPPPQEIPTLIPSPQVIPTLVPPTPGIPILVPPPLERSTLAQPPPLQEIPTLIPSPQVLPTLVPPPPGIPILVPPPLERSTLAQPPPPQEIPTLIPSPQVIPTLVPPPPGIPILVPPPEDIPILVLPPQKVPILVPPPQDKELFFPPDVRLPKWQEKKEDLAKALPLTKEEQSLERVPDEGDEQVKELKQEAEEQDKKKIIIPISEERPKTVDKGKELSPKVSHLEPKSLQELNIKRELWYQQLQKELLTEKERMQEEQLRIRGECQQIEKAKENLVQWQGLFQKQQEEWKQKQEQHKEQEHLWQMQLEHWRRLQQQNDHYQQYWAEQREKQKEQQCRLQEEVRQLQQQYKQHVILQGEQAKEQWFWNQLKEEHRKQQEIWKEEDKEYEIKRRQWQQQQAKHEGQMETLRQAHLQQEEQYKQWQKEQQKKQQELEHTWEKRWQQQLQSWQQEMQKQPDQESRDQEQKSKVLEKQRPTPKEHKPLSPKLKVVESSVLDIFVKPCKMPPVTKEKIISTTPQTTPSSSIALKEDYSELETTWFPKMFTKIEELPTYGITEKRYWINVEAQRKNLKLLREAFQRAGISPDLYNDTKETIKQALHSNVERLALLFRKYKSFYNLHEVRHSLILQLDAAREANDGAKMQNLYKMVDKVDAYQKKLLDNWKVKQNIVEKQRQHCLTKMVDLFAQLHSSAQLHLSNPCLLIVKAEDITKKETFHMPHIRPDFLKTKVYKSPLIRVKKSQDFTVTAMVRRKPSSEQIESLWKTDITELSFPLGPKAPVSFLWSETSGFPDIPRFLELDISSVRGKPLRYMETRNTALLSSCQTLLLGLNFKKD
ncbi:protein FAM186A-like [Pituophis catenifer annectens]|uniref:protein FAM186A-like n=1 Tax=Pituophis catenifer annectens TaxID=94852 RepID=UPI00399188E0